MINNDDYDSEEGEEEDLDEEDLIIQAAATATIAASLSAMEYAPLQVTLGPYLLGLISSHMN